MKLESIISEHLGKLQLFSSSAPGAEASVSEFAEAWRELGCQILQGQLQAQIEVAEAEYSGARQRRSKRYQTPLGTVEVSRRVYNEGGECLGAKALGLPADGWFSSVKELGCALGVGSEFAHANRLLHQWSGVSVTERTLANHVEASGSELVAMAASDEEGAVCPVLSRVSAAATPARVLHRRGWHSHADARGRYM